MAKIGNSVEYYTFQKDQAVYLISNLISVVIGTEDCAEAVAENGTTLQIRIGRQFVISKEKDKDTIVIRANKENIARIGHCFSEALSDYRCNISLPGGKIKVCCIENEAEKSDTEEQNAAPTLYSGDYITWEELGNTITEMPDYEKTKVAWVKGNQYLDYNIVGLEYLKEDQCMGILLGD
jgi:hypothetical protein